MADFDIDNENKQAEIFYGLSVPLACPVCGDKLTESFGRIKNNLITCSRGHYIETGDKREKIGRLEELIAEKRELDSGSKK